ncbi:MAG: LysM peptidoglycan-binding domain-containing protein [Myxococcota bacterium]
MVINKLVSAAAGAATKLLDQTATNMFGGELVKAKLVTYKKFENGQLSGKMDEIPFFLNPNQLDTKQEAVFKSDDAAQRTESVKYEKTAPLCLTLQDLIFDTYDTRKSVRTEYVDKLEKLVRFFPGTHFLPAVTFVWGQFTGATEHNREYVFYVTSVAVTYSMFLPDATPVRAKVKLTMVQQLPPDAEEGMRKKESPDHAKLYTVKRGDTLQAIANAEYEDPREWRRIAKTNNIDDPMALRPGMKILIPPILK